MLYDKEVKLYSMNFKEVGFLYIGEGIIVCSDISNGECWRLGIYRRMYSFFLRVMFLGDS